MILIPTPPPNTMVFRFILDDVLNTITKFSETTSATVASIAGSAGFTLFGIYMMLMMLAIARGAIQQPLVEFYQRSIRGVLILMFATSIGVYNSYISDTMWTIPGAIAAEVSSPGASGGIGMSRADSTAKMLDGALQKGLDAGYNAWQKMGAMHIVASIGYGLVALIIWIFVALVCAYACALILVANMGLAVMLAIGPIFILFAMFESTTPYFQAWVRQVTTFGFFFIVLSAVISLLFAFFTPFVDSIAHMGTIAVIIGLVKIIVICTAALIVLYQSHRWAEGIAGGIAVTASGYVGRWVRPISRGLMHAHYDPMKKNKDGTYGGHKFRGVIPTTVNAGRAAGRKAKNYLRKNSVRQG